MYPKRAIASARFRGSQIAAGRTDELRFGPATPPMAQDGHLPTEL
jgi:hypothetical protein